MALDKRGNPITPSPTTAPAVAAEPAGLSTLFKATAQTALEAAGVTAGFTVVGLDVALRAHLLGTYADLATARAARARVGAPMIYAGIFEPTGDGAWRRYETGKIATTGRSPWLVPAVAAVAGLGAIYLFTRRGRR